MRGSTFPTPPDVRLLDHRYFYYENNKIHATGSFIVSAAQRILNEKSFHMLSVSDYLTMIENMKTNQSMIGFAAEGAVISSLHVGTTELGKALRPSLRKGAIPVAFSATYPHYNLQLEGFRMYVPDRFNFPAIDLLMVERIGVITRSNGMRTANVYPIQVTLSYTGHSNSETAFFKNWPDWSSQFDVENVKIVDIEFIWITPLSASSNNIAKDSLGFKHPAFRRRFISFGNVNAELDAVLKSVNAYKVTLAASSKKGKGTTGIQDSTTASRSASADAKDTEEDPGEIQGKRRSTRTKRKSAVAGLAGGGGGGKHPKKG
jgi:hypothetical protein